MTLKEDQSFLSVKVTDKMILFMKCSVINPLAIFSTLERDGSVQVAQTFCQVSLTIQRCQ